MLDFVHLLAQDDARKWLQDHPLVVTVIAALLSAALLFSGIRGLQSGQAEDKLGTQHTGGTAAAMNVIRIVGGAVFAVIALYGLTRVMSP